MKTSAMLLILAILSLATAPVYAEDTEEDEVERIEIQADRIEPDEHAPSAQATVITREEIVAAAPRNLSDIIAPVLGIQIERHGGVGESSFVSIRGSSPEQVLVLVDGRRLNSAQGGGVDLSSINLDDVERIEIFRGGNSSVFGENSLGGTVNIITRKQDGKRFGGSMLYSVGSFDTITARFSHNGTSSGGRAGFTSGMGIFSTSGRYTYNNAHSPDESLVRANADAERIDAFLSVMWDPLARFHIQGRVQAAYEDRGSPGLVEFPTETARIRDMEAAGMLFIEAQLPFAHLSVDTDISMKKRDYEDPDYFSGAIDDTHKNSAMAIDIRLKREDSTGLLKSGATLGYGFRVDSLDSTAMISADEINESSGTFIRNLHTLYAFLALTPREYRNFFPSLYPSIRYDMNHMDAFTKTRHAFSWNIGMTLPLAEKTKMAFRGNIGQSHRIPSFSDLFWPSTAFAVGNPSLDNETALIADAGITAEPFKGFKTECVYFYHRVEDLIVWTPGAGGRWRPSNLGLAVIHGLETELKFLFDINPLSSLGEFAVNATLMYPVDRSPGSVNEGKILPRRAQVMVNSIAAISHIRGHSLRLEARYIGHRYITTHNTKHIEPCLVMDLGAVWQATDSWKNTVSVRNLLNTAYVDLREFPIPGISIDFTARMEF